MRWLAELAPAGSIPQLVFYDPEAHLLGMEAVPEPHENWKTALLAGRLEPNRVRQFAEILASVHRQAWLRRNEVASVFAERRYFESLRLEPYYAYTAGRLPAASHRSAARPGAGGGWVVHCAVRCDCPTLLPVRRRMATS